MKILCTGDLHIGRRPSRLPAHFDGRRCSAAAAWEAVVELAVREQIDAVAISGDLIDKDNRFFEAFGPLERGLRKLSEANIQTFAVAGNHDYNVLPQLARTFAEDGSFHLLGREGRWERKALRQGDGPLLYFDGWSYPAEHVDRDPLASYHLPAPSDAPVIGLLHADLGQSDSRYAPVALRELKNQPVAAWLLGHIHRPMLYEDGGGPLVLYPGSPQGLDPGETGSHGSWFIEIDSARRVQARQIPLARVRYETEELDLTGIDSIEKLKGAVPERIRQNLTELKMEDSPLEFVSYRFRLIGRTRFHRQLEYHLADLREDFELVAEGITAVVDKIEYETRPDFDLVQLARGNDAPAVLAKLILEIQEGVPSESGARLLNEAQQRLSQVHRARPYAPLQPFESDAPPDGEMTRDLLHRQALLLLDTLLAQKEEGNG